MEDVHTQSNFNYVSVNHMSMQLTLDMDQKNFTGHVDLHIVNRAHQDKLVLDTSDLNISAVTISDGDITNDQQSTEFMLGEKEEVRGQALSITISPTTKIVRVFYHTTAASRGLDWIEPKLTKDNFPMVVTQFQAINARTFVPCQDTPAQKITYDAHIRLSSSVLDPRMRVVMAAMERKDLGDRNFSFRMTNPIPTYLIALAAGVFEEREVSPRVSVIAEPSMVDRAREEFADAEKMVKAAESMFGDYDWGRFDIFIMPPSFSYGGMENPTMTFIGPTVVAGDKSLVDVIAHELAHSWAGNWVTNRNWNEFWINEGTTMYLERLIVAQLYGPEIRDLDINLGQQILRDNIIDVSNRQGSAMTRLKLELNAAFDPDEAVSHIPYEKGFNFWLALEQAYGQENVIEFLRYYFTKHGQSTMDSVTLRREITEWYKFVGATQLDIDDWFYGEGLPKAGLPVVKSALIDSVELAAQTLRETGFSISDIESSAKKFETKQWSYFLRSTKAAPSAEKAVALEKRFGLIQKNDEVRGNFYEYAIQSGAFDIYESHIDEYLGGVGRMKYVAPIYKALIAQGRKDIAAKLFKAHEGHNNPITNGSILRLLH